MNKKIFFGIYLLAILLLVVLPINDKNSRLNHTWFLTIRLDYICHALLFSPWMFCYRLLRHIAFARYVSKTGWFFAGLCFGAAAELIQYFTPYRALNVKDLIANVAGISIGALLFMLSGLIHTKRETADH